MTASAYQQCVLPACGATYDLGEALFACPRCGGLLDVRYDWSTTTVPSSLRFFDQRRGAVGNSALQRLDRSGVWRFRELLPFASADELVTIGEGQTILQRADGLAGHLGMRPGNLLLQYEGFNPSGSFKDNGMAAAFTMARRLGRTRVACASTGNTSASMAMYAANTSCGSDSCGNDQPMHAVVFVGDDKIAMGKLSQALDYGATTLQVRGDFDACMKLVQESAAKLDLYLMNSVNPFRIEGQKTIMYRVLEELGWEVPDWIIVPGGNLGNTSAFAKAFDELQTLGLIDRVPRLAVINATGANSLCELYNDKGVRFDGGNVDFALIDEYYAAMTAAGRSAQTVASAVEIGRPVNLVKALRSLDVMNGVVAQVSDEEILEGKALVGRYGYGCEPASGASIAGLRALLDAQVVSPRDRTVCILTGHGLKDPGVTIGYHTARDVEHAPGSLRNPPKRVEPNVEDIAAALSLGRT